MLKHRLKGGFKLDFVNFPKYLLLHSLVQKKHYDSLAQLVRATDS